MQTLTHRHDTLGDRLADWISSHKVNSALVALCVLLGFFVYNGFERLAYMQTPDLAYDTRVTQPAYATAGPMVLFDAGHWNVHKPTTTYLPFANLIRNDGYQIRVNSERFAPDNLRPVQIVIISNAFGIRGVAAQLAYLAHFRRAVQWDLTAFTPGECVALREWVRNGGGLLLVADHAPAGSAARTLAEQFAVTMTNWGVDDDKHSDSDAYSWLVFSRDTGLLLPHPVTDGRNPSERVNRVVAFTGQSLLGPPGSVPFMTLADSAREYPYLSSTYTEGRSAAGKSQGIAFVFGKGRVVVLGEAAMLSAQVFRSGGSEIRLGMEYPGCDNRQLALNIMHWLSRLTN